MTIADQEDTSRHGSAAEPQWVNRGSPRQTYIASRRWFWLGSLALVGLALVGRWWMPDAEWPLWLVLGAALGLVVDGALMALNWRGVARGYIVHQESANRHVQGFWTQRLNGALAVLSGLMLLAVAMMLLLFPF